MFLVKSRSGWHKSRRQTQNKPKNTPTSQALHLTQHYTNEQIRLPWVAGWVLATARELGPAAEVRVGNWQSLTRSSGWKQPINNKNPVTEKNLNCSCTDTSVLPIGFLFSHRSISLQAASLEAAVMFCGVTPKKKKNDSGVNRINSF